MAPSPLDDAGLVPFLSSLLGDRDLISSMYLIVSILPADFSAVLFRGSTQNIASDTACIGNREVNKAILVHNTYKPKAVNCSWCLVDE